MSIYGTLCVLVITPDHHDHHRHRGHDDFDDYHHHYHYNHDHQNLILKKSLNTPPPGERVTCRGLADPVSCGKDEGPGPE